MFELILSLSMFMAVKLQDVQGPSESVRVLYEDKMRISPSGPHKKSKRSEKRAAMRQKMLIGAAKNQCRNICGYEGSLRDM